MLTVTQSTNQSCCCRQHQQHTVEQFPSRTMSEGSNLGIGSSLSNNKVCCCCCSQIMEPNCMMTTPSKRDGVVVTCIDRNSTTDTTYSDITKHIVAGTAASSAIRMSSEKRWLMLAPTLCRCTKLWTVFVCFFLLHLQCVSSVPVATDCLPNRCLIYQDSGNNPSYFFSFTVDPNDETRIYIGAKDFVYLLNAKNISLSPVRSENISATTNYATAFKNNVIQCLNPQFGFDIEPGLEAMQCSNYVRAVFVANTLAGAQLYVCSTGSFVPQEFYLDYTTLTVTSVQPTNGSGRNKCPYNPLSTYSSLYVSNGNPFNISSVYAAVPATQYPNSEVAMFRPALVSPTEPTNVLVSLLRTETDSRWINLPDTAFFVSSFDIGQYVYFFLREVALESTALCGRTYFSRVARICKQDQGVTTGNYMQFRFTTFLKSRIVCSLPGVIQFYFNEIIDVQYNPTTKLFYAVFINSDWGSAVCSYSLASINGIFDNGTWLDQKNVDSAWTIYPSSNVPNPRPGQCNNNALTLTTLTFIHDHPLMSNLTMPVGNAPVFYTKNLVYSQLEVDNIQGYTVLYLYSDDGKVYRYAVWSDVNGPEFQLISIWQPFTSTIQASTASLLTGRNLAFHSIGGKNWLYLTTDAAVVQLDPQQCSTYVKCNDCVRDPYCGWDTTQNICRTYQTGLLQGVMSFNSVTVCGSACSSGVTKLNSTLQGVAVHASCSSYCSSDGAVTWSYYNKSTGLRSNVQIDNINYFLTTTNDLLILSASSNNTGEYSCIYNNTVLATVDVTVSMCQYGEDIGGIWLNEYQNWCAAFDDYYKKYNQWVCQKKVCSDQCSLGDKCPQT